MFTLFCLCVCLHTQAFNGDVSAALGVLLALLREGDDAADAEKNDGAHDDATMAMEVLTTRFPRAAVDVVASVLAAVDGDVDAAAAMMRDHGVSSPPVVRRENKNNRATCDDADDLYHLVRRYESTRVQTPRHVRSPEGAPLFSTRVTDVHHALRDMSIGAGAYQYTRPPLPPLFSAVARREHHSDSAARPPDGVSSHGGATRSGSGGGRSGGGSAGVINHAGADTGVVSNVAHALDVLRGMQRPAFPSSSSSAAAAVDVHACHHEASVLSAESRRLFVFASNAFRARDHEGCKRLGDRGKALKAAADSLREKANAAGFRNANAKKAHTFELDLHGITAAAAVRKLEMYFLLLANSALSNVVVVIITGRGAHSGGGGSVLGPATKRWLDDAGLQWSAVNQGAVAVKLR